MRLGCVCGTSWRCIGCVLGCVLRRYWVVLKHTKKIENSGPKASTMTRKSSKNFPKILPKSSQNYPKASKTVSISRPGGASRRLGSVPGHLEPSWGDLGRRHYYRKILQKSSQIFQKPAKIIQNRFKIEAWRRLQASWQCLGPS